jgi:sugar phosphate isomerase/epimerase
VPVVPDWSNTLPLKIGIQLASLRLPFKQALHTAGELGAEAVEIDARGDLQPGQLSQTGLRQLRKMLEDRNLRVGSVTFRTRRGYAVADHLDERIAATKEAMKFAYSLGAAVVVNQIGRVPAKPEGPEWDTLVSVLSDLGNFGQHIGAWLAAETGTEEGSDLARLLDALPTGTIGVTFDPGNLVANGFSARNSLLALAPRVLHVHAKDGVRDLAQGRGVEVPLGRGSVDFAELIGTLQEHEFRGYYMIEREKCADPIYEIGQAVKYLRSLV